MDHAVALVQAYLQINGYFTVAEYPIIESTGKHHFKTATDLDILAFRFPGAGRIVTGKKGAQTVFLPDPLLGVSGDKADMLIGEIKEGKAELNRNARNPNVLRTVLARFGCCSIEHVDSVVEQLIRKGKTTTHNDHHIRLMAFGSVATGNHSYSTITTGHIVQFIERYLDEHWEVLRTTQFKHPALGLFMVLKKAREKIHPSGTLS
ncbi:MAG TPA: hypothetical protein EYH06_10620 [Chromatiales bacterium]|nr:hypothetical protein [Thiotrichales bacterium]HIP69021.1 hypothetical protein [Chromatiales bacterium]